MTNKKYEKDSDINNFLNTGVSRRLVILTALLAVVYFLVFTFYFEKGNLYLYTLLILGAVFYLWQVLTFLYTTWDTNYSHPKNENYTPKVDVFITVCGEPLDIIEETVSAAKSMKYPNFSIHILNDGFVAKKENWRDVEVLARQKCVNCITRRVPGGAKAGNINNAMKHTYSPYIVIFDADHVPHRDFLQKTMGYFFDHKMGYVQSPQYYKNHKLNRVTSGAWSQQTLFFGAICKGKNRLNSVTMCGTNMVIRRKALELAGGMCEASIAEDFLTGLFIHELGYKSAYVPEVLAEGLAPEDLLSYCKQQFRWARGSMDVVFKYLAAFFRTKLTITQKIQYLSSVSFFFSGIFVAIHASIPAIFLFTGEMPFNISTMELALVFIPYIFLTLLTIQQVGNYSFNYRALAFCMAGFVIHIKAFIASLFRTKSSFSVTSKKLIDGNFINLVIPHLLYILIVMIGLMVALLREGISPSLISNMAWAIINIAIFYEFILAALPKASPRYVHRGNVQTNLSPRKVENYKQKFQVET